MKMDFTKLQYQIRTNYRTNYMIDKSQAICPRKNSSDVMFHTGEFSRFSKVSFVVCQVVAHLAYSTVFQLFIQDRMSHSNLFRHWILRIFCSIISPTYLEKRGTL